MEENMKNTIFTADGGVQCKTDLEKIAKVMDMVKDLNLGEIDTVLAFANQVREGVLRHLESYKDKQSTNEVSPCDPLPHN